MRKFIFIISILFMTACTPCQVQWWLAHQSQETNPAGDTYAGCEDPVNADMDYCKAMIGTTTTTTSTTVDQPVHIPEHGDCWVGYTPVC